MKAMLHAPKDWSFSCDLTSEHLWNLQSHPTLPLQLQQLHYLIVFDDEMLSVLRRKSAKRMCACEFKPGDIAWNCKECQVDETCVMCNDCFIASDHTDHQVFFYYTHSGGCCDCGDPEAWAPEGFCSEHKGAQDKDLSAGIPSAMIENARACLGIVVHTIVDIILDARRAAIIREEDISRARQTFAKESSEKRYTVLIYHNELQSSQDFATALSQAHPAVAYQMLKLVNETSTQKQSVVRSNTTREDALELAEALHRHGIVCSIVSNDFKIRVSVISGLIQYLVALANLSDGFCRLICEQFVDLNAEDWDHDNRTELKEEQNRKVEAYALVRNSILADSFLPKKESDALHSLLMALLADPLFKRSFAIAFTYAYDQLYREFVAGIGSSNLTILAFSVQFFNRASFVRLLVEKHDLLSVLVTTILETLQSKFRILEANDTDLKLKDAHEINGEDVQLVWREYVSDGSKIKVLERRNYWDLYAAVVLKSKSSIVEYLDLDPLSAESNWVTSPQTRIKLFLSCLPVKTALPGRHEIDLASPVFVYRRYMSGLLDLRYALQIDGVAEQFISMHHGKYYVQFLLYLSHLQGVYPETRRLGDHVEMESRAWVAAVEYVSTVCDVFTWIITNVMKNNRVNGLEMTPTQAPKTVRLVGELVRPLMDSFYFWLISRNKYYPPKEFQAGDLLREDQVETSISCHFPIHRAFAQLLRTFCDLPPYLAAFYRLMRAPSAVESSSVWVHSTCSSLGFWHCVQYIEPVLQAIVWDAQVHCGMWVRNGMAVMNHSMNYGEPPFCLRFRDLDLLLLQFSFQLAPTDWLLFTILDRFGITKSFFELSSEQNRYALNALVAECLKLFSQLATELPPKLFERVEDCEMDRDSSKRVLDSLIPFLRRELIQRLCVGPCGHSDLSKIATEFFSSHEHLFASNFSSGIVLDQILTEICVMRKSDEKTTERKDTEMDEQGDVDGGHDTGVKSAGGTLDAATTSTLGKLQYRLKPELLSEYSACFVHLTRKQHESAHDNWLHHRLRQSKECMQQEIENGSLESSENWRAFPLVRALDPCAPGFYWSRLAILHEQARWLVFESLWHSTNSDRPHRNLTVLSCALHLLTLQVYVMEDLATLEDIPELSVKEEDLSIRAQTLKNEFLTWLTQENVPENETCLESRCSLFELLLRLNPWNPFYDHDRSLECTEEANKRLHLEGDQKHELGRGVEWIIRRLALLDERCQDAVNQRAIRTRRMSQEKQERNISLAQRRREAQKKAMERMRQRQAAFAAQVEQVADDEMQSDGACVLAESFEKDVGSSRQSLDVDMTIEPDANAENLECAMCHTCDPEESFMCFVGFAQSSAVCSRLHAGDGVHTQEGKQQLASLSSFWTSPIDEMHFGEDVPVHVRLCGHAVHHKCWESYHASQFQRVITGAHHRHALNAVDVTKKEFLCPLCKSISNILIPNVSTKDQNALEEALDRLHGSNMPNASKLKSADFVNDSEGSLEWLKQVATGTNLNLQCYSTPSTSTISAQIVDKKHLRTSTTMPAVESWLEHGLASLCMALHKVASGAMQKSRPDRYTNSACHALFHTLLCLFLTKKVDQHKSKDAEPFLAAMKYLPLMLRQVGSSKMPATITSTPMQPSRLVALAVEGSNPQKWCEQDPISKLKKQIYQLLHFGGSEIKPDGSIVLEDDHPSTQTQTRKQSQWEKLRRPIKPLLLSHLGSVLIKGILSAGCLEEAWLIARLVVLARMIQTLLWLCVSNDAMEKSDWIVKNDDSNLQTRTHTKTFIECFFDHMDAYDSSEKEAVAATLIGKLRAKVARAYGAIDTTCSFTECDDQGGLRSQLALLTLVANEVVPVASVAVYVIQTRFSEAVNVEQPTQQPWMVSNSSISNLQLTGVSMLLGSDSGWWSLASRWINRFKGAYDEMQDPNSLLAQWLLSMNLTRDGDQQLTYTSILTHDLYGMHCALSIHTAAKSRIRYLKSLPHAYVRFYSELAKRKCESCNQFPTRPAVCLICGLLLCAANTCRALHHEKTYPEESNPGACTIHAKKCGRGVGMFLLVLEGAVLLVYWKLAAYVGSLYVDEYGEEFGERNRDLNKGRPLYLNQKRRDRLLRLWLFHEIPNEVVKIQNTSERVIRNSHY
ncbi:unnamed protein product [Albugo candida]|nr:unnamed protein product [Albugo candida]|eukprot:CCI47549.1 unnamed protein product [Albugo candida]